MWKGTIKIILYVGIVLIPVVLRSLLSPNSYYSIEYEIGRNFALIGFTILLLQILLAGRFQWISKTFGVDIVIRYHKYMAIFATVLLVLHPLLLAYGGDKMDVPNWIWFTSWRNPIRTGPAKPVLLIEKKSAAIAATKSPSKDGMSADRQTSCKK